MKGDLIWIRKPNLLEPADCWCPRNEDEEKSPCQKLGIVCDSSRYGR